ncbi:type II toxin-antitoxin system YafQ family toxin [Desulfosarcina sp. OttesenSCG-928-B08]|nr:type II toxin-antitoxin system YafQ family toxin [Desulfosarcina sp. OttesenSCG-928-B08]
MRDLRQTTRFRRDLKKVKRSGFNYLDLLAVVSMLLQDIPLPLHHNDHPLIGQWAGARDCHIKPDWVLIYQKVDNELWLLRTGTHADLFG